MTRQIYKSKFHATQSYIHAIMQEVHSTRLKAHNGILANVSRVQQRHNLLVVLNGFIYEYISHT